MKNIPNFTANLNLDSQRGMKMDSTSLYNFHLRLLFGKQSKKALIKMQFISISQSPKYEPFI
jgi:hypothetical protein